MYTRCPRCATIFTLSMGQLGAHHGLVRCGECGEVFNASWSLVDRIPEQHPAEPARSPEPDVAEGSQPPTGAEGLEDSAAPGPEGLEADQGPAGERGPDGIPAPSGSPQSGDEASQTFSAGADAPVAHGEGDVSPEHGVAPANAVRYDEEVVIESPAMVWEEFHAAEEAEAATPADERAADSELAIRTARAALEGRERGPAEAPRATKRKGTSVSGTDRQTPGAGADKAVFQRPARPGEIRPVFWFAAGLALAAVMTWQLQHFYLRDLAQVGAVRPYVKALCAVANCVVPEQHAIRLIDLMGTDVVTHPQAPGALRVTVNLVNRAEFAQPFPPLEVSLTDKGGRVVGRRTYLPDDYRHTVHAQMAPNVLETVNVDLAEPPHRAVGYEIQLVSH